MKIFLSGLFTLLIFCVFCNCNESQDHRITLVVTGDATSTTISGSHSSSSTIVTQLPWSTEYHDESGEDNKESVFDPQGGDSGDGPTKLEVSLDATNNTAVSATISAYIYVDGDLKLKDTKTGPNCNVRIWGSY